MKAVIIRVCTTPPQGNESPQEQRYKRLQEVSVRGGATEPGNYLRARRLRLGTNSAVKPLSGQFPSMLQDYHSPVLINTQLIDWRRSRFLSNNRISPLALIKQSEPSPHVQLRTQSFYLKAKQKYSSVTPQSTTSPDLKPTQQVRRNEGSQITASCNISE